MRCTAYRISALSNWKRLVHSASSRVKMSQAIGSHVISKRNAINIVSGELTYSPIL